MGWRGRGVYVCGGGEAQALGGIDDGLQPQTQGWASVGPRPEISNSGLPPRAPERASAKGQPFPAQSQSRLAHFPNLTNPQHNEMTSEYSSKTIRTATVTRQTAETDITCTITLDHEPGVKQQIDVSTGIGFLDHVSTQPFINHNSSCTPLTVIGLFVFHAVAASPLDSVPPWSAVPLARSLASHASHPTSNVRIDTTTARVHLDFEMTDVPRPGQAR